MRETRTVIWGLTFLACLGWAVVLVADLHDNVLYGRAGLLIGGLATFGLVVGAVLWWESYARLRPSVSGLALVSVGALGAWALSFLHGFQLCGVGFMCDSGPFPGEAVWESSVVWVGWIGLVGAFLTSGLYSWSRALRKHEASDAA